MYSRLIHRCHPRLPVHVVPSLPVDINQAVAECDDPVTELHRTKLHQQGTTHKFSVSEDKQGVLHCSKNPSATRVPQR